MLVDTGLGVSSLASAAHDLFQANLLAVATHAHTDHIGSFHEFDRRAIHAAEADVAANIDAYIATMHRLRRLPVQTVHGGHDRSMDRRRFHEVIDDYLRRRELHRLEGGSSR